MSLASIETACQEDLPWLMELIDSLVRLESPTTDKIAVNRCGAELARRLADLGAVVTVIPNEAAGDHLRAEFGTGARQLLVLGHIDTVWPVGQLERMPLRIGDGRLHGPGVYDMKAGIALAMLALRVLVRLTIPLRHRVVLLFTADEETGSATSRRIIEEEADRSAAVLVMEPPLSDGGLKTARKGVGRFWIEAIGVAAHAGIDPDRGASAILELAHQILALEQLRDPNRGVTLSVGLISGGTRVNVVPDYARAELDVRVGTMAAVAGVQETLAALRPHVSGVTLRMGGGIERPPLERTSAVAELYLLARGVAAEIGRDLPEGSTGGASDGNFTAARGVPTLDGLGAIGGGAHALDEHVVVEALPWRASLIAGLIARIGQRPGGG
jgi:glutamate carboxypeptidase